MQKFLKELLSSLFSEKQSYREGGSPLSERQHDAEAAWTVFMLLFIMKCIFWKKDWKLYAEALDRDREIKNIHQVQSKRSSRLTQVEPGRYTWLSFSHIIKRQYVLEGGGTGFQFESLQLCVAISPQLPWPRWTHFVVVPHKAHWLHLKQATPPWQDKVLWFGWWVIWDARWQQEKQGGLSPAPKMALKSSFPVIQCFIISQGSPQGTLIIMSDTDFPCSTRKPHTHAFTYVYTYMYFSSYRGWEDHHGEHTEMPETDWRMNKKGWVPWKKFMFDCF